MGALEAREAGAPLVCTQVVGRPEDAVVTGIYRWAARQQGVGEGGPAVVCESAQDGSTFSRSPEAMLREQLPSLDKLWPSEIKGTCSQQLSGVLLAKIVLAMVNVPETFRIPPALSIETATLLAIVLLVMVRDEKFIIPPPCPWTE